MGTIGEYVRQCKDPDATTLLLPLIDRNIIQRNRYQGFEKDG